MEIITAKISSVLFSNRHTGFCILKVTPKNDPNKVITIKGNFFGSQVGVGLMAKFSGSYEDHSTYGRQLVASTCEVIPEPGRIGIVTYLSSNVPSIGPITAAKLYTKFGDGLIDILNNDPDQMRNVDFLTKPQVDAIIREWSEASEGRTVAIFLSNLGLNSHQVKSAFSKFGLQTRAKVNQNPYCLYECYGVGFVTADNAARKLNIGIDDIRRIKSMILFVLSELSASEGHVYCSSEQVFNYISSKIFRKHAIDSFSHGEYMSDTHFYDGLNSLVEENSVHVDNDKIYLSFNWVFESESSEALAKIIVQYVQIGDLEKHLNKFEELNKISLSDEQREAFFMLKKNKVCVISGYPGTGKTTLISAFVHLFEQLGLNYTLMSPTGIAAKRLSQVTGRSASTIHRALGYKRDGTWDFHKHNKFAVDAIIVDEVSMLDAATFYHLISSIPSTTIIVMIGDSAQLPSVGAGYVLGNLMKCPDVPHVSLTKIYRQEKQSDIIKVAHAMLRNQPLDTSFKKDSEFVFLNYPKDQIMDEICKLSSILKSKDQNFQIIAPMYAGDLGIDNLNRRLRNVLNLEYATNKATKLKSGDVDLYEGDRVMIIKNDYDRVLFNGDAGKIQNISIKNNEVEVKIFGWFDAETNSYIDKCFFYSIDEARQLLKVSFACSCHRSQGQEYDYVIMPMSMQYGIMLYKNLVYTAITRAKKKVFVFGDPDAFTFAASCERDITRNSNLAELVHVNTDLEIARFVQES